MPDQLFSDWLRDYTQQRAKERERKFFFGGNAQTETRPLAGRTGRFAQMAREALEEARREQFRCRLSVERWSGVTEQREKHLLRMKTDC